MLLLSKILFSNVQKQVKILANNIMNWRNKILTFLTIFLLIPTRVLYEILKIFKENKQHYFLNIQQFQFIQL